MANKNEDEDTTSFMKFHAPAASIFLEKPTGKLEPLPSVATDNLIKLLENHIKKIERDDPSGPQKDAKIKALGTRIVQLQTDSLKSIVDKEFALDFVKWLQGKSVFNLDPEKTPWGSHPLVGPSIHEYIRTFATEKIRLNIKMTKLRILPPDDIFTAWLYYKYVVREAEVNSEDAFIEQFNWWTSQPVGNRLNPSNYDRVGGGTFPSLSNPPDPSKEEIKIAEIALGAGGLGPEGIEPTEADKIEIAAEENAELDLETDPAHRVEIPPEEEKTTKELTETNKELAEEIKQLRKALTEGKKKQLLRDAYKKALIEIENQKKRER